MSIVLTTDFSNGRYKIPQNTKQTVALQEVIDYVEGYYLPRLMGVALNTLFQADLTGGVPVSARFLTIFNPFTVQEETDHIVTSDGMKAMLEGLIYFYYQRGANNRSTTVGAQRAKAENSDNSSVDELGINSRYNQGITNFLSIQYHMEIVDPTTYPEYTGITEQFNHPF